LGIKNNNDIIITWYTRYITRKIMYIRQWKCITPYKQQSRWHALFHYK